MKYNVKKTIEECGELITALVKHDLHATSSTKAGVEGEIADVLAMLTLIGPKLGLSSDRMKCLMGARMRRELGRK
jgi:NTP pyrophosphatase (non-canonical NTP hydrolase)